MEKNLQSAPPHLKSNLQSSPPHLKSKLIRACAGGGKTTHLIHHLLEVAESYYFQNETWPRIAVTTFTNKATEELKERILKHCIYKKPHLIDFITSEQKLHISTLHGILNLFLKKMTSSFFPSFTFQTISSFEKNTRLKSILKDLIFEDKKNEILLKEFEFEKLFQMVQTLGKLSLENPSVRPHDDSSFMSLYKEKINQWILSIKDFIKNFNEDQNKEKINEFLKKLSALRDHLNLQDQIINEILELKNKKLILKNPSILNDLKGLKKEALLKLFSEISSSLEKESFLKKNWEKYFYLFKNFEELSKSFHLRLMAYKEENNFWEIEDLEFLSWKLISEKPNLALDFSNDWDYWLIDEYQDTSLLQHKIFNSLIQKKPSFIVGDIHQSIYLFRGASSEVLKQKEDQFLKKGAEVFIQNKNFRACPELLHFLNDFFSSFSESSFVFKKMEARNKNYNPKKNVCSFSMIQNIKEKNQSKENEEDIQEKEYLALLSHIQKLKNEGKNYKDICILGRKNQTLLKFSAFLKKKNIPYSLYGSLKFSERREILDAKALLKFLLNPHDDYNLILLLRSPFFHIPDPLLSNEIHEAKDSFWNHLTKNQENLSKQKHLFPILKLKSYLKKLKEKSILEVYKEALLDPQFLEILSFQDSTGQAEANLWKWIIEITREEKKRGFKPLKYLMEGPKSLENDLDEYFSSITEEPKSNDSKIRSLEKEVMSLKETDSLNLMTIHAAKGLSFKHVLLISLHLKEVQSSFRELHFSLDSESKWSFPISFQNKESKIPSLADEKFLSIQRKKEKEESYRLLYVALTRAEESLFLSWIKPYPPGSWADLIESFLNLKQKLNQKENYSYEIIHH